MLSRGSTAPTASRRRSSSRYSPPPPLQKKWAAEAAVALLKLTDSLSTQVLSVGNLFNPDVRYSFNIPIEDKPQQFFWDAYGPWQECSRLCQGEWVGGNKDSQRRVKLSIYRKTEQLPLFPCRALFFSLDVEVVRRWMAGKLQKRRAL